MNLLGIEMVLLVIGIIIVIFTTLTTIANCLLIIEAIKKGLSWTWNVTPTAIFIFIGIMLIIISQNI